MTCMGCDYWRWDGEKSVLGIDLIYGKCSELNNKETAHNETCKAEVRKEKDNEEIQLFSDRLNELLIEENNHLKASLRAERE